MQSRPADGTGRGPRLPGCDQHGYSPAMAFRLGRGGKRAQDVTLYEEEQVIWGVPRRSGLDEQDDPKAHGGLTQHAFEIGNDERAICGFEPPKRASSPTSKPRAQLAVPNSRLNPRCPKCLKLMAVPAVAVESAELEATDDAVGDEGTGPDEATMADGEMTQEEAPNAEVAAAVRIGEAEVEGPISPKAADEADLATEEPYEAAEEPDQWPDEAEPFGIADAPDPSIMAIVAPPDAPPRPPSQSQSYCPSRRLRRRCSPDRPSNSRTSRHPLHRRQALMPSLRRDQPSIRRCQCAARRGRERSCTTPASKQRLFGRPVNRAWVSWPASSAALRHPVSAQSRSTPMAWPSSR